MSLLDEIKRQAETQEQRQQAHEQDQAQILTAIHAALAGVFRYFNDLAGSLNVVKPQVVRNFAVQGTATLQGLRQGEYFVRERKKTIDLHDYFEEITLHYRAAGEQVLTIETYADHATDRLRNYLLAYGLRYDTQAFRNDRGVTLKTAVTVLPEVPAAVTVIADWDAGTVRFKLRNVETIGDAEYGYDPAEVDGKLLDELGKLLLGQPNELRNMGRHQESLRIRIVPRPAVRDPEPEPAAPEAESRPGLFVGLKSLWKN